MTKEDFDVFVAVALDVVDDTMRTEYYDTEREILKDLLSMARGYLFTQVLKDEAEHAEYLRLKAKFEPETINKGEIE